MNYRLEVEATTRTGNIWLADCIEYGNPEYVGRSFTLSELLNHLHADKYGRVTELFEYMGADGEDVCQEFLKPIEDWIAECSEHDFNWEAANLINNREARKDYAPKQLPEVDLLPAKMDQALLSVKPFLATFRRFDENPTYSLKSNISIDKMLGNVVARMGSK